MIVDWRNLGRFYRYVNGKLSCKAGVGPIRKSDGSFVVNDKEKADEQFLLAL